MRKEIKEKFEELEHWFSNMTQEAISEAMEIIGRMLASLPGGEEFEGLGYEPYDWLGWHEYELITDALQAVDGKKDVEDASEILLAMPEEDEDY